MTDAQTLLPPNSDAGQRAIEQVSARVGEVPVPIADIWNPWTCPEALLPYLAWALSVDGWNADWPLATRRAVIAGSLAVHRIKGTPPAVIAALAAIDVDADIEEWFEYDGEAYRFRVAANITSRGLNEAEYQAIKSLINSAKNIRSHLDTLTVRLASKAEAPLIGMTCVMGAVNTVYPLKATPPDSKAPLIVAMGVQSVMTATVYPGEAA